MRVNLGIQYYIGRGQMVLNHAGWQVTELESRVAVIIKLKNNTQGVITPQAWIK